MSTETKAFVLPLIATADCILDARGFTIAQTLGATSIMQHARLYEIVKRCNSWDALKGACEDAIATINRNMDALPNTPGLREMLGGIQRKCERSLALAEKGGQ